MIPTVVDTVCVCVSKIHLGRSVWDTNCGRQFVCVGGCLRFIWDGLCGIPNVVDIVCLCGYLRFIWGGLCGIPTVVGIVCVCRYLRFIWGGLVWDTNCGRHCVYVKSNQSLLTAGRLTGSPPGGARSHGKRRRCKRWHSNKIPEILRLYPFFACGR